ncbi:MAG: hypothetical protein ACI4B9_07830 [Eggerthellaceae bacterium]
MTLETIGYYRLSTYVITLTFLSVDSPSFMLGKEARLEEGAANETLDREFSR